VVDGTEGEGISIGRVDTVVVNAEMRNWIFVRVRTNVDGLYGWGEASLNWKTHAVIGAIEDLGRLVTGRPAWDITRSVMAMRRYSYYRLGIVGATAISGIEQALWDLKA
jgi:galactonate dehydratase